MLSTEYELETAQDEEDDEVVDDTIPFSAWQDPAGGTEDEPEGSVSN